MEPNPQSHSGSALSVANEVKQATIYAAIVLCFTVFLFSFIIPKFSALLSGLKIEQPLITRIVFAAGDFAKNSWYYWLPGILLVLIAVPRQIKKISAVIEPTLMLFLIGIVGWVALAIYFPIISLMGAIK